MTPADKNYYSDIALKLTWKIWEVSNVLKQSAYFTFDLLF